MSANQKTTNSLLWCIVLALIGHTSPPSIGAITPTDLYTAVLPDGYRGLYFGEGNRVAAGGQLVGRARMPPGSAFSPERAMLSTEASPKAIDLTPATYTSSRVYSTNGRLQVGRAVRGSGSAHAMLWRGSASDFVDLNPAGAVSSGASDTADNQQVGSFSTTTTIHAALWFGTAESVVDLHPQNVFRSGALGTDGTRQVGFAYTTTTRAMLWSGSAESVIDLHPNWLLDSRAVAVSGSQQVGNGTLNDYPGYVPYRALLWTGSADSAIDLTPADFKTSLASDTDGTYQVGYGSPNNSPSQHALLWNGSASSYIDLHAFLPANFLSSYAYTIDGNHVFGLAYDENIQAHAIVWTIPEPSSLAFISLLTVLRRERR